MMHTQMSLDLAEVVAAGVFFLMNPVTGQRFVSVCPGFTGKLELVA
jgi:hypothetical protein